MKRYLVGGAALLALSACATKPEPIQETRSTAPVAAPEVFSPLPDPTPAPAIVQGEPEIYVPAQDLKLPFPGSVEDFAYQSGGEPRVYFGYNQYDLSAEAKDKLRRQADWLNLYADSSAVIEGHADERGTREYNLALGARRADSIKAFLVSQGVAPSRLRSISYGKERPIDGRANEDGWSRNRNGYTEIRLDGLS